MKQFIMTLFVILSSNLCYAQQEDSSKVWENAQFKDNMYGIWVSDYSYDENGVPFLAIEISKNEKGASKIQVLPYCTFAKEQKSYKRKSHKYVPTSLIAYQKDIEIYNDTKEIFTYIGHERHKSGSVFAAVVGVALVESAGMVASQIIHDNMEQDGSVGGLAKAIVADVAVGVVTAIFSSFFASLAVKKTIVSTFDIHIREKSVEGVADITIQPQMYIERSDGDIRVEKHRKMDFMMFKFHSHYDVTFTTDGGEMFGTKNEIKKDKLALNDVKTFNRKAYENLHDEVMKLYELTYINYESPLAKLSEDESISEKLDNQDEEFYRIYFEQETMRKNRGKISAEKREIQENFRYSTRGALKTYDTIYTQIQGENGSSNKGKYIGRIDRFGKFSGYGYYAADAFRYEGEWKDGKYHGYGEYEAVNDHKYEGYFSDGKKQGKATYYSQWRSDSYGEKYHNQIWRDGKLWTGYGIVKSSNSKSESTYEGEVKNGKYHGLGRLSIKKHKKDTPEKYEGYFENGKFIQEHKE